MKSSTLRSSHLGGLRQGQVALLEQAQRERPMHPDIEKPIIEGDGKEGRPAVLRDDRNATVLGRAQQLRRALSQVANAERGG